MPYEDSDFDFAEPRASAMIESLRAFGYTLEAAVADLIDNSISASAANIWLDFWWDGGNSSLSIKDDGCGMSDAELKEAMRPGSRSPLEARESFDLGRFGLGLKTASFSQCRSLTVLSKRDGTSPSCRLWDLDYVSAKAEWRLLKGLHLAPPELQQEIVMTEHGTFVVWRKLDRIVGQYRSDDTSAHRRFLDGIDTVKHHLAMVFHRYLAGPSGLKLWLNGRQIKPWDPFLAGEVATQRLGTELLKLHGSEIVVTPYVLPHHSKIDQATHRAAAGPKGWNAQQGFYVYRNRRLLVAGDWLSLGFQKEEHFKLARIQVDIPNTTDSDWDIDVKKSRARPPGALRNDFRRIASATRTRASEIYRHRGKVIARESSQSEMFVWLKKVRQGKVFYEINRDHPVIQQWLAQQNGHGESTALLLRLIEETVPVAYIVMNNAEAPDSHSLPFQGAPPKEVSELMSSVVLALIKKGLPPEKACQRASVMEPFNSYPELVALMLERYIPRRPQ
jgi:hypothetical protein